ncbi:MAG: prepilin peptidase [Bryobacteraceae bacterium]
MYDPACWPAVLTVSIASITDLRSRKIPNWLSGLSFLAALIVAVLNHGVSGLGKSLEGAALGAGILGLLYCLGGMGMGDVKLCLAVGAWLGPGQLMLALVVMGLAGGAMALGWAIRGGFLKQSLEGAGDLVWGWRSRTARTRRLTLDAPGARSIPYAPAIAIGTVFSFLAQR